MPRRSWNDINDSDSSLSSQEEHPSLPLPPAKQPSAPPPSASKLKSACDQMSLKKLDKHEGSDVWLYVPNSFYGRCEEVNAILQATEGLKKIMRIKTIGWNVLTTKETGRLLVQDGLSQEELLIKFNYSNRNQERPANSDDRSQKAQKKVTYVEKVIPQAASERYEVSQQFVPKTQGEMAQSGARKGGERKKVKWVEKKASSMKEEDPKTPLTSYEQLKSPPKYQKTYSNYANYKSPKKWEEVHSPSKDVPETKPNRKFKAKEPSNPPEVVSPKVEEKPEVISEVEEKAGTKIEAVEDSQQPIAETKTEADPTTNIEQDVSDDRTVEGQAVLDDSSDESIEKKEKKKKKKRQKKSTQPKVQKPDGNRFSFFAK